MSSDPPSDGPSSAEPRQEPALAATLQARGEPLLEALDRHQAGARQHAHATAAYAFAAATELGLEGDRAEAVREAAMLHEIGQVYVPSAVLAKPAAERDAGERAGFEAHHEAGYRLARGAGLPEQACGWLLRTRENFDGSGPEGLSGDQVPIESRVIRAACVFHTALSERLAEVGGPAQWHAIERISTAAGSELDPRVVLALSAALERAAA